jgi:hypothetical protein
VPGAVDPLIRSGRVSGVVRTRDIAPTPAALHSDWPTGRFDGVPDSEALPRH